MADQTAIEWADSTLNPWIGCTKVSPGCDNCYAARQDNFRHWTPDGWGGPRKRTSPATWKLPELWNKRGFLACTSCGWRGEKSDAIAFGDTCPRCEGHAQNARRRVFCASLADVFDNQVPREWRADLFRLIRDTPNLDWLLLTKRIGNAAAMLSDVHCALGELDEAKLPSWPWPNVWLGATIVNQEEADRDIPKLLATPARVRFLSMEPLLGPVDLTAITVPRAVGQEVFSALHFDGDADDEPELGTATLDWVIAGGESGPGARPMHPGWAQSIRDQCAAAGVPFLWKQWGEWIPISQQGNGDGPGCSDFPGYAKVPRCVLQLDGEVREAWPAGAMLMRRVGKKAAGRLLDGVTHDGFPEVR